MTPDTSKGAARRLRQLITQVGHRRSQVLRTAARGAAINPTPSLPGGQRARHMRTRNLIPIRVSPRARLKVMTRIEEFDENQNTDHLYEHDDIDYSTDLSDIDEEPTIHNGMVLVSDGRGKGRPARLELTKDILSVQVPIGMSDSLETSSDLDSGVRTVTIKRQKDGGLGLSVKGGSDVSGDVPVLISKIFKDQAADETGQLFVGDAIVEVNGVLVEGRTHDEVVNLLKNAGEEITIVVRHYTQLATYLRPSESLRRDRSGSALERYSDTSGTWKSSLKAHSDAVFYDRASVGSASTDDAPDGWKTLIRIPLPMAYITRYLWGTDKLRPNAFELRAVDGSSTGVVHCEDGKALDQWVKHIQNNITNLNQKSIKMSNKYLHSSEQIVHLGWICERMPEGIEGDLTQKWEPRFLILKGSDVCIFETPPLNADDLAKCVCSYKIFDTAMKIAKDTDRQDKREHCFWIETAYNNNTKHYVSVETKHQLSQVESSWYRTTHNAVSAMQSKTFACNFDGRPSGLVIDLRQGFSLYDIPTKRYIWQYRFSELQTSADDGKMRMQLVFRNANAPDGKDVKDLDCAEIYPLVYTMHSFYLAKIIGQDPDFLKTVPL